MQKRLLFLSIALSLAFGVLGGFSSNISSVTASSKPKKTFVKPEHTKKTQKEFSSIPVRTIMVIPQF